MKDKAARQLPKHADEADEQDRCLDEADRQRSGHFGELAGIFMQSLVRVDAKGTRKRKPICSPVGQPPVYNIARQAFSHVERCHLIEPGLHDIEQQKEPGDECKVLQLDDEFRQVAAFQRIVERCIPAVEKDLAVGREENDRQQGRRNEKYAIAHRRLPEGLCRNRDLPLEADLVGRLGSGSS